MLLVTTRYTGAPLASLIARAKGIKGAVTAESWAAAGMDQLIAAAEAAQGDAQVDAFAKLTDGYNQLLPKQPEVPEPKFEQPCPGQERFRCLRGRCWRRDQCRLPAEQCT